jgi:YD repeat-containing protein
MLTQEIIQLKEHSWASPDRYSFNVPTGSGEFYINPVTKEIVQSGNLSNVFFIERKVTGSPGNTNVSWTIRDTKGNVFYFDPVNRETTSTVLSVGNDFSGVTYRLTSITTSQGDLIQFRYQTGGYTTGTYTQSVGYNFFDGIMDGPNDRALDTGFGVMYVSEIETRDERIEFELSTTVAERADLPGSKRINAIHVWDKRQNRKIKTIRLDYSFFDSDLSYWSHKSTVSDQLTKRLRLDAVTEVGYKSNGQPEDGARHSFEYQSLKLPRKDSYARDHWGFFNGRMNHSFLPDVSPEILSGNFPIFNYDKEYDQFSWIEGDPDYVLYWLRDKGTANKGMSPEHAKAALLKKIIYPTKGYTSFEFEPHTYKNYRTYSAVEHETAAGILYNVFSIVDKNKTGDVFRSAEIAAPDGILRLDDFVVGFAAIDPGLWYDHDNNSSTPLKLTADAAIAMTSAWVRIYRVGDPLPIHEWRLNYDQSGTLEIATSYPTSYGPDPGWSSPKESVEIQGAVNDRYYIEAYLPTLPVTQQSETSAIPRASASASFSVKKTYNEIASVESIGGGLRVKTITNVDGLTGNTERIQFRYVKDDGVTSSGKLMSPVMNVHYMQFPYGGIGQVIDIVQLASFSYTPLSSDAQGSVVGYDRVEVFREGNNRSIGKTVSYYRNKQSSTFPASSYGNFKRPIPTVPYYDNGLVDSTVVFNSEEERVKKTVNTYTNLRRGTPPYYNILLFDREWGAQYQNSDCQCQPHKSMNDPGPLWKWCEKPSIDRLRPKTLLEQLTWHYVPRWVFVWEPCDDNETYLYPLLPDKWLAVFVPIKTQWHVPFTTTETSYDGAQKLTTTSTYAYNSFGQLTSSTFTSSKNETKVSKYVYPMDRSDSDPVVAAMKNKKLLELPIEESEWKGEQEISKSSYGYQLYTGGDVKLNNVKKSLNGSPLIADVTDIQYGDRDNILTYKKDGITTSFIWGYSDTYPVAQIENASYVSNNYTDIVSESVVDVVKTVYLQPAPYTVQFAVPRSGNITFSIGMYSAPVENEGMRINCTLIGTTANGTYEQSFQLCLTTGGSQAPVCPSIDGQPVTFSNIPPGQYTFSAVINYDQNVGLGRGRRITIAYPDRIVHFAGAEFYYENFETSGTEGTAHTGEKFGTQSAVSWAPPNARAYVISYWYRENGEWKFSGRKPYTGTTYTLTGGDAYDDVRIHPKDALMTNYSFEPLIGMSAQIDPSGITTYYEYDALNRLRAVKDHKGNILRTFQYHFKGQ